MFEDWAVLSMYRLGVRDNERNFPGNHLKSLELVGVRSIDLGFGGKKSLREEKQIRGKEMEPWKH